MEKSKPKLEEFLRGKGIFFYPSAANFLLLKFKNPEEIIKAFKNEGILVRPKHVPSGEEGVRVSIGTLRDTERFIEVFSRILDNVV